MRIEDRLARIARAPEVGPGLAGAIATIRAAQNGDLVAQEIIKQFGGNPSNLLRWASGLPVSAFERVRSSEGEP